MVINKCLLIQIVFEIIFKRRGQDKRTHMLPAGSARALESRQNVDRLRLREMKLNQI